MDGTILWAALSTATRITAFPMLPQERARPGRGGSSDISTAASTSAFRRAVNSWSAARTAEASVRSGTEARI